VAEGGEGNQVELGVRLDRSSRKFARSALSAMSDGEHAVCLLHAATALEHLAKAVLADVHPSLIAVAARGGGRRGLERSPLTDSNRRPLLTMNVRRAIHAGFRLTRPLRVPRCSARVVAFRIIVDLGATSTRPPVVVEQRTRAQATAGMRSVARGLATSAGGGSEKPRRRFKAPRPSRV
jgi:hypothetical protein